MAICDLQNPDLKKITDSKADLKSKMTEGLSGLGSMEDIQKKMNEGFSGLTSGATGPATVCNCVGGDPLSFDEESCLATGGVWECKEVENYNLQEELLALNNASPANFASGVQSIKEKFGGLVPDLNDKIKTISPAMGDFFENFQMPPLPKAGDTVLSCNCVGGDPLASTEDECLDSGGSWVCTEEVLQADLDEGFVSQIQGGIGSLSSFFGDSASSVSGGLSGAFDGLSGALSSTEIPSFPKPGEMTLICNCVGGVGAASTEDECREAGGSWVCEVGPAPEIPNFFGGDGLPKISKETMCNAIDNVEVKDVEETDPQTGIASIIKKADVLPKEPSPPTVVPAAPPPAPVTKTENKKTFGGAQVAEAMTQKSLKDTAIKTSIKYGIDETRYAIMYLWIYREMLYRKAGKGSVDDYITSKYQWLWANPLTIDKKEATIRWKEWQVASAKAKNKEVSTTTIDQKVDKLWPTLVKIYSESERSINKRYGTEYAGEQGWIKFLKDSYVKYNKSTENKAATKIQVEAETPAVQTVGSQVTAAPPTLIPDTTTKEEIGEQPEPPTGEKCVTVASSRNRVCFDQAVFEYTSAGSWKHVPTGNFLPNIVSQEQLKGVEQAIKSKGTYEFTRSGRSGTTIETFDGGTFEVTTVPSGKVCQSGLGSYKSPQTVCYDSKVWSYDGNIGVFVYKATKEYFDFSDQESLDKVESALTANKEIVWRAYYAPTGTAKEYRVGTDGRVETLRIVRPGE